MKKTVIIAVFMEQTGYTKDDVLSQFLKYWIKRGPRTVEEDLFRFDQFRMLVWEGIRKVLRPVTKIYALRMPV